MVSNIFYLPFHIRMSSFPLTIVFQRGRYTTKQIDLWMMDFQLMDLFLYIINKNRFPIDDKSHYVFPLGLTVFFEPISQCRQALQAPPRWSPLMRTTRTRCRWEIRLGRCLDSIYFIVHGIFWIPTDRYIYNYIYNTLLQ